MQNKVVECNLEYNMPIIEFAVQKMKNVLTTSKGLGYKTVILVHGYGSSGVGAMVQQEKRAVDKWRKKMYISCIKLN